MAFRRRSFGRKPDWLKAATDFRFVGHDGDDATNLHFEAPIFGEACPTNTNQGEFWPSKPSPDATGFEVFADMVRDLAGANRDSDRFDRPLLKHVMKLHGPFKGLFHSLEIGGDCDATAPATDSGHGVDRHRQSVLRFNPRFAASQSLRQARHGSRQHPALCVHPAQRGGGPGHSQGRGHLRIPGFAGQAHRGLRQGGVSTFRASCCASTPTRSKPGRMPISSSARFHLACRLIHPFRKAQFLPAKAESTRSSANGQEPKRTNRLPRLCGGSVDSCPQDTCWILASWCISFGATRYETP